MDSQNIIVREMTANDIESVLQIERQSFSIPWTRNAFEIELKKNMLSKYVLAEIEGEIVGYAGMWIIMDEIHITNIAVSPVHRGKGIGDILLEEINKTCERKKMRGITLEVRKSNYVAQSLYKKHGFEEAGIRPKYYSDNKEDAIIMWKIFE